MHVGWAAVFAAPEGGRAPDFDELLAHLESRLCQAPRFRQRIAPVPLGIGDPVWVDDPDFRIESHIRRAETADLGEVVDEVMSRPLGRDRPLWEFWFTDPLPDGSRGMVGKLHHCMVDGIAAVELGMLLLDPSPEPPAPDEPVEWVPHRAPGPLELVAGAVRDLTRREIVLAELPLRAARHPRRIFGYADTARRAAQALGRSVAPAPRTPFNVPISPRRHLVQVQRPFEDLRRVKAAFGTTVNDVVLAVAAGALHGQMRRQGTDPYPLKAMVPVNARHEAEHGLLGNRLSFVFIELPVDEPDPHRRLMDIHVAMDERKRSGEPEGGEAIVEAMGLAPHWVQSLFARRIASPRTFNLAVSNIPGPRLPMYMLGARLGSVYPVVPLADRHALSIGFTTVGDRACFGIYADPERLDADLLGEEVAASLDELLHLVGEPGDGPGPEAPQRWRFPSTAAAD